MTLKSHTEKDATAPEVSPSEVMDPIPADRDSVRRARSRLGPFAALILIAAVGAVLVLRLWIARDRTRTLDEWHGRLAAIADDRRRALEIWVKERRADARVLASSTVVVSLASGRLLPPGPSPATGDATQVRQILSIAAEAYGYRGLWLLACDGAVLSKSAASPGLTEAAGDAARRACDGTSEVVFHRNEDGIRLYISAPVPSNVPNQRAAILAETDPEVTLFPMLKAEPLPTRTGETLLVTRDGSDILFLSPLRHDAAAPLTFRRPAEPGLAGTEALRGGERFDAFRDYRGTRVLAATRPIQATYWALVVKVDEVEALAAHHASGRAASLGMLGLLSALLSVGFLLWRGERGAYEARLGGYRAQLASLLDHANDAILFVRRDGRIFHANRRAERLYGYTLAELLRMSLHQLRAGDERQFEAMAEAIVRKGALVFESVHRRRDRTTVAVEVSSAALEHEGQQVFLALVRDITERKAAEALRSGEHHVLEMIASGAPLPDTLDALVRVIEKQADGVLGSVLLLEGTRLRHGAAPSLPEAYSRAIDGEEIGPLRGSCGTSAYLRQPVIVTDIATDPLWAEFRDLGLRFGLRACWSVPIVARDGSVLGTFALYYREPHGPTTDQLDLLERARHVAAIAITRLRSETELRELSGHIERVREDERTAIAREIHDELGQALTALKMDISWLGRRLGSQSEPRPDLVTRLGRMSEATDATINEMRRIAANLRPGVLDELGLRAAVEWQSREFEERTQIACSFHSNLDEGRLDPDLSTGVFRIVQEALTNVARHAGARHVDVALCQDGLDLTLKVQDDGRGVAAQEVNRAGRFGSGCVRGLGGWVEPSW